MELGEAQNLVDQWIKKYGVRYFNELTNLALLVEEVGEFARIVARKYGEQSYKKEVNAESTDVRLSEELADILFVVICLANQMGINLDDALKMSLEKKTHRDYDRHCNNPKLDQG